MPVGQCWCHDNVARFILPPPKSFGNGSVEMCQAGIYAIAEKYDWRSLQIVSSIKTECMQWKLAFARRKIRFCERGESATVFR